MKSRLLNVPESDLSVSRLDTYHPPIPVSSTDDTLNMIIDGYRLFDHVVKGDPKPLPGQKIQTAGPNRVCPPNERSARLEAPSMPTMQQEMTHFGNVVSNQVDAYANMMANPMQMMRRQQPLPRRNRCILPRRRNSSRCSSSRCRRLRRRNRCILPRRRNSSRCRRSHSPPRCNP